MPDIAELFRVSDALDNCFDRVILIASENHQHLIAFVEHDVFGDQLGKLAFFQECFSKLVELRNFLVFPISPEERLLEVAVFDGVVGEIFGIDSIADDENLDVAKQPLARQKRMSVVTVDLIERLFQFQTPTLQFNVNQGQPVDQQRHVIAVGAPAFHGHLTRYLILVLAPADLVNQLDVAGFTAVFPVVDLAAQGFGFFKDVSTRNGVENLSELRVGQLDPVVDFKLALEICDQITFILNYYKFVSQNLQLVNESVFKDVFGLSCHYDSGSN